MIHYFCVELLRIEKNSQHYDEAKRKTNRLLSPEEQDPSLSPVFEPGYGCLVSFELNPKIDTTVRKKPLH